MGRRSLARERREQILEAFEECVLERGLDGASIAATAEVAGMDRTLVHHYFGTREALESALVDRLIAAYRGARDDALGELPADDRVRAVLDQLFGAAFVEPRLAALFDALLASSHRSPTTRERMLRVYREFEDNIRAELDKAYPKAPATLRRRVAFSLVCLSESSSGFVLLGYPAARQRDARAAAEILLATLDPSFDA